MTRRTDDYRRLREETLVELKRLVRHSVLPWKPVRNLHGVWAINTRDLNGGYGDGLAFVYLEQDEDGPTMYGLDMHPVDADQGELTTRFEYWGLPFEQLIRIGEREAIRSVCGTTCDQCPHATRGRGGMELCGHQGEQGVAERDVRPVGALTFRMHAKRRAVSGGYPWGRACEELAGDDVIWVLATDGDPQVAWLVSLETNGQVCVVRYEGGQSDEMLRKRSARYHADVGEAMGQAEREYDIATGREDYDSE